MTITDTAEKQAYTLGLIQGRLALDDAAWEVFTNPDWRDGYCYTDMIEIFARAQRALDNLLPSMVEKARNRDGATWTDIGHALGTTRQAAQQRFGN